MDMIVLWKIFKLILAISPVYYCIAKAWIESDIDFVICIPGAVIFSCGLIPLLFEPEELMYFF